MGRRRRPVLQVVILSTAAIDTITNATTTIIATTTSTCLYYAYYYDDDDDDDDDNDDDDDDDDEDDDDDDDDDNGQRRVYTAYESAPNDTVLFKKFGVLRARPCGFIGAFRFVHARAVATTACSTQRPKCATERLLCTHLGAGSPKCHLDTSLSI